MYKLATLREVEGKVQMHGSHQVLCLRQAIRKPLLANCNPISISYPIPLGLTLFYSICPHSSRTSCPRISSWICPVLCCSDTISILAWKGSGRYAGQGDHCPETNLKVSNFSLEMYRHFPATQIQVCLVQWVRFRCYCFPYSDDCSRKGCCVWVNQVPFMAERCREAEFLICLSKPVSKEFLMFAACALYLKDKIKGKCVCPSWPSLHEYLHFIPDHLRCDVYLLTIW